MEPSPSSTLQYSYTNPKRSTIHDPNRSTYNRTSMGTTIHSFANSNISQYPPNKESVYVTPTTATTTNYPQRSIGTISNGTRIVNQPQNNIIIEDNGMPTTFKKSIVGTQPGSPGNRYVVNNETFTNPVTYNQPRIYNPSNTITSVPVNTVNHNGTYIRNPIQNGVVLSPQGSPIRSNIVRVNPTINPVVNNITPGIQRVVPVNQIIPNQQVIAAPVIPSNTLVTGNTYVSPVVERKLIYVDPVTGARMMKVCTPEGTIKRVEVLDQVPEPVKYVNNDLDDDTSQMIRDAKREFSDPEIEEFECDDCKLFIIFFINLIF